MNRSIRTLAVVLMGCLLQSLCPAKTVNIGTGSGDLVYPTAQATLNLQPGDTVYITPGTYASLQLSGITGTAAAPITVKADPKAVFTTTDSHPNNVRDLAFVVFDGLTYRDYNGPAMRIGGASHDVTFQNGSSTRGGDFSVYDSAKVFDGTKDSAFYNFKWQNWAFYSASIHNSDWKPVSNLLSLWLDFEIANCTFTHYEAKEFPASPISATKAFNLRVHDCTFSDVGVLPSPAGHGVCIGLAGYGKIYNNKFTRQWADDVREFPFKLNALGYGGPDAVTRFYNNISYEKRKYAMFEHNGMFNKDIADSKGYFSPTGAEICFNTLYRSRKVDYVAPLVDIYAPNMTIRYNLVIDPECDAAWNPKFNLAPDAPYAKANNYVYAIGTDIGATPNVVVDHNLIFQTLQASGLKDAEGFAPSATSPVSKPAGNISYITDDYYHKPRHAGAANVGAVERP